MSEGRAGVLQHTASPALYREVPGNGQSQVLGPNAGFKTPGQAHAYHPGHFQVKRLPGHGRRNIDSARSQSQHPQSAAGGRVAVRAQKRSSGQGEPPAVNQVADAVSGPGYADSVLFAHRDQIGVIVGIPVVQIDHVVVQITDGALGFDLRNAEGFKGNVGQHPQSVLGQGLVDGQGDLISLLRLPLNQMGGNDFLSQIHGFTPPLCRL